MIAPTLAIARAAGERILAVYRGAFAVDWKADESPLTAADLAAHEAIVAGLGRLTGDLPILSEESAAASWEARRHWRRFWLVDPLDGTREFIQRNDQFTVNIALIEDSEPVLGVVLIPAQGLGYFAARGFGAFRQADEESPQRIAVQPLQPEQPIRVVGSRSHGGPQQQAFIARIPQSEFVALGSALKFCWIAEGRADVYPRFGPTYEWDTAAAQCVVEEAGGHVVTLAGERLRYNKPSLLNPHFLAFADIRHDWRAYLAPATP
ncbi:MAG: 3'(2'),5'-bisphosphate nucleotidase CysQ [Gammaproteobacteria bacterium]